MSTPGLTQGALPSFCRRTVTFAGSPEYEKRPGVSRWTYSLAASSAGAAGTRPGRAAATARDTGTRTAASRATGLARSIIGHAIMSRTSSSRLNLRGDRRRSAEPTEPGPSNNDARRQGRAPTSCYDRTEGLSNRRPGRAPPVPVAARRSTPDQRHQDQKEIGWRLSESRRQGRRDQRSEKGHQSDARSDRGSGAGRAGARRGKPPHPGP